MKITLNTYNICLIEDQILFHYFHSFRLNISGCGITGGPLAKAPTGVWSATSAENPPSCGDLLARAIGLAKTPLRTLDISVNDIGSVSIKSFHITLLINIG